MQRAGEVCFPEPLANISFQKSLGSGTFGTVELVKHDITGELFSRKRCNKAADEIRILLYIEQFYNKLDSPPFTIQKIRYCSPVEKGSDKEYDMFLEYFEGEQLENHIFETGEELLSVLIKIASALDFVHSTNIAHMDLTTSNVLVSQDNEICLIDFGLSEYNSELVKEQTKRGTPLYCPPEMFSSTNVTDFRKTDIWAFGVMTFYLFTDEFPFDSDDDDKVLPLIKNKIISKEEFTSSLKSTEKTKDKLFKLVSCCTKKNYKKRPTASQIVDFLSL